MTFGNPSLRVHVFRGLLGFGTLVLALRGYNTIGWPAPSLLIVSVLALKGCPICWTIGLFETVAMKMFSFADDVTEPDGEVPLTDADPSLRWPAPVE